MARWESVDDWLARHRQAEDDLAERLDRVREADPEGTAAKAPRPPGRRPACSHAPTRAGSTSSVLGCW